VTGDIVLELKDISKQFAEHRAVDGVSIQVPRGNLFALLGPSGCGKTTTLRLVAGFEEPTAGEILLNGTRINHLPPYARNVTTVFQSYALFPHLTAAGNVEFGLKRKRMGNTAKRVRDALELVQLTGKEQRYPSQLSGGERQRVALARALVLEPDVLLLDEPLSALDPQLRKQVRAELKQLQRRVGTTFLFVTHDQEEALSMSDRIALMRGGRVEQIGTPRELYQQPASRFVAGFLGAVNWVNGSGVRPEVTRVSREQPAGTVRAFPAQVLSTMYLGNCVHVEGQLTNGERVIAEVPPCEATYRQGDDVHMWWDPRDELPLPHAAQ
jgi:ABC-type Fe3+/spermidine/putrescine transport system ATPase subunit